jgi:hypothetical protein
MMDYLNSLYIDDEMDLDEKVQFIETIRKSEDAYREAMDLLAQERLLRCALAVSSTVPDAGPGWRKIFKIWWAAHSRPVTAAVAGLAVGLMLFVLYPIHPALIPESRTSRFVVFLPQAERVELSGTFTEWQRLPMQPAGRTGYWELNIPLTSGEHRYVFILDDGRRITDPTQLHKERDDFGGENSIIKIGDQV